MSELNMATPKVNEIFLNMTVYLRQVCKKIIGHERKKSSCRLDECAILLFLKDKTHAIWIKQERLE